MVAFDQLHHAAFAPFREALAERRILDERLARLLEPTHGPADHRGIRSFEVRQEGPV